ncbi:unnamed protein product [Durusdinium trenchii]|uniref:Mitotic-spindle organizing protein 1 n=1 Tax=Durusdinium trenchii TaxID=1381693 RepID=A0ABP0RMV2_9DINO
MDESEERREAMEIFSEISGLLNTGLKQESLAALVGLCELGVNPEALAQVVKDLRAEKKQMSEADVHVPDVPGPASTGDRSLQPAPRSSRKSDGSK